jgi:hypothetical protein
MKLIGQTLGRLVKRKKILNKYLYQKEANLHTVSSMDEKVKLQDTRLRLHVFSQSLPLFVVLVHCPFEIVHRIAYSVIRCTNYSFAFVCDKDPPAAVVP